MLFTLVFFVVVVVLSNRASDLQELSEGRPSRRFIFMWERSLPGEIAL